MAFRDDRDALLARTDALQREHDRLEQELEGTTSERDELRAALSKNEKELAKLRKKVAPTQADLAQQQHRKRLLLVTGLAVGGGLLAVLLSTRAGKPEEPSRPAQVTPAVASSSSAPESEFSRTKETQLDWLQMCLTGADLDLRGLEVAPGFRHDRKRSEGFASCDEQLQEMRVAGVVIKGAAPAVHAYADSFAAWRTSAMQLMRYYAEDDDEDDGNARGRALGAELDQRRARVLEASDALRADIMPLLNGRRAKLIAALRAEGKDPQVAFYELAQRASDFIGAVIAPTPELRTIEASLAALVEYRDAHPELESNPISKFFEFAKHLVRGLRAAGSPVMGTRDLHAFRMMTSYFRMAALDR